MEHPDNDHNPQHETGERQQSLGLAGMSAAEIVDLYYELENEFEQAEPNWPERIAPPPGTREAQRQIAFNEEIKTLAKTHLGKAIGAIGLLSLSALPSARYYAACFNSAVARVDFDAALPLWVRLAEEEDDPMVLTAVLEDFADFMQSPEASQVSLAQAKPLVDALDRMLAERRRPN